MNIASDSLWNVTAFAGVFGIILVFLGPTINPHGDLLGEALVDLSESAEKVSLSNSVATDDAPSPTSLPDETVQVERGEQVTMEFLEKTSRIPFPLSTRYESATGECFYRLYDGSILTILKDSLIVVDVENLRRS